MKFKWLLPSSVPERNRPWTPLEKWLRLILFIVLAGFLGFLFFKQPPVNPVWGVVFLIGLTLAFILSWRKGYFPF